MTITRRRALSADDLPQVVDLLTASDTAVLGRPDFTETEIEGDLRSAVIEAQGWYDDAGALVAYGWVRRTGTSHQVDVDAYVHPSHDIELGTELLGVLEARGLELVAEAGHDRAVFDIGVYREDVRTRHWVTARGYELGTTFTRMRLDFDGPVEVPRLPDRLVVRRTDATETDLRIAYEVDEESFTDHYGHVASEFADFHRRFTEGGDGWCSLWLAELDGIAVGVLVGTRQFEQDDNAGYVRRLGVIPAGRGLGVGKALLRHYFAACQAEGRDGVLLHVDVANVTNALGVYESVGMRPTLEIDAWTKTVSVG